VQVGSAADLAELALAPEMGGDRDGVGRLPAPVEVDDRVEDELVGGAVEVDAPDRLDDVGDRVLGQQHRPEDALLGVIVLRRSPSGWSSGLRLEVAGPARGSAEDGIEVVRWLRRCWHLRQAHARDPPRETSGRKALVRLS
jgi:hypothetical protein